ncbi:MAG: exodeoxyribonuclease VII large subunit [Candidatus Zambryskibacteria bacterium RIFCSPLOWO2_02_FULL_39_69]|uniref:Exodeoxyribonuclease 7 large subunit n=3 Tax=Candidatus Zambryskiibacteriota TaxID=1817925 RepID=A0A1G2T9J8_9BACT|nr:MAG: exodeoxyribonuclease VII large subunit [Candidatus Zambryskibacteria bacterium RIFCSPHIGHO2_02_38_10.5]OHA98940.1 MAG: exodeoxyribonuclease VII large subunit [Candidatus Zambryskibacteria bacterium RIFCSPHIGHO2_12_FULL_38_37]OHB07875.1 MAG: exodeoxyribonuclease VII large subunit [Candidatus Zambryskibacteria bacterium RIFCSPLOWO2_02_39_10]OHB10849.1 MAG: exodeoxyribonuclease VII large subunit [Candidatus Zambryskibacteria bacterium RIFCSPLOWO2_02_FULL_39_69]OHB13922.1 MAG: exodeoxyribon
MNSPDIISVSQYLDKLNVTLKVEKAKIVGEVSGVQEYPGRSYLYFSIKDGKDQSTLKCFMWKRDFKISGVEIKDGMEVIVSATPNIYKPNGGLTLQVEQVELVGEGALEKAYNELKKKLESEGLFTESRKREIPSYPHRIGVITSKSGAVINDFLGNLGKFGFEILFVDSKVEGQDAVKDLISAMKILRDKKLDVLVIMRGGGSLESFMAFNNEMLVRTVASFGAPVLTGIGHDKDISLVSLVSDKNVSTPTAVANLLNSTWSEALSYVRLSEEKIFTQFQSGLQNSQFRVENSEAIIQSRFVKLLEVLEKAEQRLLHAVVRIESGIARISESIFQKAKDLERGFVLFITNTKEIIKQSAKAIEFSSPERALARGYSIVRNKGKVLKSVKDAKVGDGLDILVSDGIIQSKVI